MYGHRKPLFLMLAVFALAAASFGSATNIYLAQSAAGAASGADCADAKAASFFNSASSWGSGAGQIGPGTTVHLCGTITGAGGSTMLTFQGSGASGNPVTVLFESGASLTAPYWGGYGGGAINGNGQSWITVNGGSNGSIVATANGNQSANQQQSVAVECEGCNNAVIENLSITNMYVQAANSSSSQDLGVGVDSANSSSITIAGNKISNAHAGVQIQYNSGTSSNIQVSHNVVSGACEAFAVASGGSSPAINGIAFHDNEAKDGFNWDNSNNDCHEDALHGWAEAGGNGGTITGLQVYNEFYHGNWGCHQNGYIYFEADIGTIANAQYYNNVLVNQSPNSGCTSPQAYPASGFIGLKGPGCGNSTQIYNNTMVGDLNQGVGILLEGGCANVAIKNNIVDFLDVFIQTDAGIASSNNNDFFNGQRFTFNSSNLSSLSAWQAACGCDASSTQNDPKLDANFKPQSGSAAVGLGANLTSLSIAPLDKDKAGVARPVAAAWDAGAYQVGLGTASTPAPNPPTALSAVVQ